MIPQENSVFKTTEGETKSMSAYDAVLTLWPTPYEELDVSTCFGVTHIIASGPKEANPIILLHGQDSTATSWVHNIRELSSNFRVFAVDTIGDMGKSKPVHLPKNRKDYADWLNDIFDQLKIEKADLVGYSYGGFLATNFAIAHPERLNRMVLLAPGIPNIGSPMLQWAYYGMPMIFLPSHFTIKRFINGTSTKGYSAKDPIYEQMIIGMTNMRHVSFIRPTFTDDDLKQIATPTLLLIGDHEIMYEPRKTLERARQLIPNLRAALIAGAGHLLNSDQPTIVNQCILEFLREMPNENRRVLE
jgi:pimeloyl-ACP methyl ester carboxylesterase